jgi:glucokinase
MATKEHKYDKLLVDKHNTFESAIEEFLRDAPVRPSVAVIAIAGPIKENTVRVTNVEKWGKLVGSNLATVFRFDHFIFLNDFEAAAYGASVLTKDEVIHINQIPLNEGKVKAVVGPGTGLGTAMLFPAPFRNRFRSYVIPGEGGHVNFAPANDLEW